MKVNITEWAKPLTIVDEVEYRERIVERAKLVKPDVIFLYDKLKGNIEWETILEELRIEIKKDRG